ncbi:hypothetical protein G6F66_015441 [Rhizopus arrhizus]|nr:hypothetical protein G6F66_015441 [Rhizopus arrhizus]KAG1364972.1 hypothetical protein G6F59_018875 [Rhizopus arrhizus]
MRWVPQHGIHIHHGVEHVAAADPPVHLAPHRVLGRAVMAGQRRAVQRALVGCNGGPDDAHVAGARGLG